MLPAGHQHVSLSSGISDERVGIARDPDDVIGTTLEAIFADIFVEQPSSNTLDEVLGWHESNELTAHRARQFATNAQPRGVQTLADRSGLQSEQSSDLWKAVSN